MSHRLPLFLPLLLLVLAGSLAGGWLAVGDVSAHDRPSGPVHKTRSAVIARRGMACTSQPLATQAALDILRRGGNAIDAAIAANAVLGVVEPMSCGVGGDLFALIWDARTNTLHGLNASGRAPRAATLDHLRGMGLEFIPIDGPLSWSVPGCVDGWEMMRERFGSRSLAELLQPAVFYAEEGFPVSEIIAADWNAAAAKLAAAGAACYLPEGRPPAAGDVFRNPGLARTLRQIGAEGRDAFYRGAIAREIVAHSRTVGGLLDADDLARHRGEWVEPVSTTYRGYQVWELPPNGQGIAALQMLNMLEPHDLKAAGFGSPEVLHWMIEAKKLAFEDRARFYADGAFSRVPVAELISKEYAARRSKGIDPRRAAAHPTAGDPAGADTVYLTVADGAGNVVSLIQSNYFGFGSFQVPGGLGFALQNRGCLFALDPSHANRLEPGKRPFHTIIPGFVTKEGRPWLSFGVMGGDMQPQGHVQVLCDMIDFGMDVQEAGDAPRWRHDGSSEPTGRPGTGLGVVELESGFAPGTRAALEALGHVVGPSVPGGFGGYQAIRIDTERGVLIGGSDPRKDGCAAGF